MIPRRIRSSIAFLFLLLIISTPWVLGGNLPPVRTICLAALGLLTLPFVIWPKLIGTPTRFEVFVSYVLLFGVVLGGIQLFEFWLGRTEYAAATRERLCELILGVAAFLLACRLFVHRSTIGWGLSIVALNGFLITFVGMSQILSGTEKLFGIYELIHGGQPFGPYVNGNNAGGYLLMCFSATIFLISRSLLRTTSSTDSDPFGAKKSFGKRAIESLGRSFAGIETYQLYAIAALLMISIGIFFTMSRGAAVALVFSILVCGVLLSRKKLAILGATVLLLGGIGLVVWLEQGDSITTNLESLADLESAGASRFEHWQDGLELAMQKPLLGHGLGTYRFLYVPLQDTNFKTWFHHAENQYLETFAELGLLGVVVLVLIIGAMLVASFQLLRRPDSNSRAVGVMGLVCISGQIVAGSLDFGLYQPANTLLMAMMMGVVFGQHAWFQNAKTVTQKKQSRLPNVLTWLILLATVAMTSWAAFEYSAVDARRAARRFNERFEPTDAERLSYHHSLLDYAIQHRPDDGEAYYERALNQILQYRVSAAERLVDEFQASSISDQSTLSNK